MCILTNPAPSLQTKYCKAKGDGWQCNRERTDTGYCHSHYEQNRLGKPVTPIRRTHPKRPVERHISLKDDLFGNYEPCLLYTSPCPRD